LDSGFFEAVPQCTSRLAVSANVSASRKAMRAHE
jgi:hypothetical protein